VRHTPVRESSPPKYDVTEGFMALAESQKQLPCIGLHASSLQLRGVIILYVDSTELVS